MEEIQTAGEGRGNMIYFLKGEGYTDFVPANVGEERCAPGHAFGPSAKGNFSFHYVVCGKGRFSVGGRDYPVRAGDCFLICQDDVVFYKADGEEPWHYIWIGFTGRLAERYRTQTERVFPYPADTFPRLMRQVEQQERGREERTVAALFEIAAMLFGTDVPRNEYVEQVCRYIFYHYPEELTAQGLADMVGLDRRYLTALFRRYRGQGPAAYLAEVRMEAALGLLKSGYRVEEAGIAVGYRDPFHFSKMFRKRYGFPPSAARPQGPGPHRL